MELLELLKQWIEIYMENGCFYCDNYELFSENSWFVVFEGQNWCLKCYYFVIDFMLDEMLDW